MLPMIGFIIIIVWLTLTGCAILPQASESILPTDAPAPLPATLTPTSTPISTNTATPTPVQPTPASSTTPLIPVTGQTATTQPTAEPAISGKISFWAELEDTDQWAIYAYDLAADSEERLTQTIQTFDGFLEPDNQWTKFVGYEYVWSPNGKLLAVDVLETERNVIDVYDITAQGEEPAPYLVLPGREPSFHPETYRIAYIDSGINTLITDGTVPRKLSYKNCDQLLYSPTEDYILCEANFINDGDFYFFAVFEDKFIRVSYINSDHLIFPKWSPNGRYLSFFNIQFLEKKLTLIDITKSDFPQINLFEIYEINQKDARDFAWHPNNQLIALIEERDTAGEFGITVFDLISGKIIFQSKTGDFKSLNWSPDGRFLAYHLANNGSSDSLVILDAEYDYQIISRIKFEGSIWYPTWIPAQTSP